VKQCHDPYAPLRIPQVRFHFFGWLLGVMGQQIQSVAVGWEIYQRTGKALSLGYVGAIQAIPLLLLALPAGQWADSFDRRKIILIGLAVSAMRSLGLAISSYLHGSVHWMYLLLFLGSVGATIGRPARQALLPQIVPAEIFSNATTWSSSMFQVAAMAGPAVGGVIVAFSAPLAYLVDAVLTLVFFLCVVRIRLNQPASERKPPSLASVIEGLRYVWETKTILATISLDMFAVLLGGAVYLLPIYASDILHVGATGFGWLRAAPAIGALLMAVAGFGVATIVFGLSRSFRLSFAMLFLTGTLDNISVVVRHTLVQLLTPDHMRGRVSAVNTIFIGVSNEIGGFESGVTAAWWGPVGSVVVGGAGTMLVVCAAALGFPTLRRLGSLEDVKVEGE